MSNVLNATVRYPFLNEDGTLKEFKVAPFGISSADVLKNLQIFINP